MGNEINVVKHLRDRYGIMQKLLICKGISRPYLSNLENGKVDLSHEMAYRIAEKLNEVLASRDINLRLDKEDLMSSKRLLTKLQLNDELTYYEQLENIDAEEIRVLEERYLLVESPYEYARLKSLLGNYYYYKQNMRKALSYLTCAFDAFVSKENIIEGLPLLEKIISGNISLSNLEIAKYYDDLFFDTLLDSFDMTNSRLLEKFYFNSAVLHKELGNYQVAISRIDKLQELDLLIGRRVFDAELLKSNALIKSGDTSKAQVALMNMLHTVDFPTVKVKVAVAILEAHMLEGETVAFKKLTESVLNLMTQDEAHKDNLAQEHIQLFELCEKMSCFETLTNHIEALVSYVYRFGSDAQIKSLIRVLNRQGLSSANIENLKQKLIDVYFKF